MKVSRSLLKSFEEEKTNRMKKPEINSFSLYFSLSLSLSLSQGVEWKVKNLSHKAKREETEMCERSHVAAGNVCVSGCDTRDPEKKKKKETREPTQKKKEPVDKSIISESNHIYSRLYTADTMCTAH